ncbi:MAG: polyprenyl synthetase family protein [Candidatus Roizmanbacteria bacterium]
MRGSIGKQYLAEYQKKTENIFDVFMQEKIAEAEVAGEIPREVVLRYWKISRLGKKIRGSLVVLGYQLAQGIDINKIIPTSLIVELFHAGLLVQDDVMDNDSIRRGITSLHRQFETLGEELKVNTPYNLYGESLAICAGDLGFYYSWDLLLRSDFDPNYILQAGKIFTQYAVRVMHGQVLDVTTIPLSQMKEKTILNILQFKTAEYTGVMPLLIGAVLGGMKEPSSLEALKAYGLAFGWAFQIQDDILGIFGKPGETGKADDSDIKEGKNTLLVSYLAKHGTSEERAFLYKIHGSRNATQSEVEQLRTLLRECGAYQHVIDLGWKYVKEGASYIPKITKDVTLQNMLESLIYYMMERTQ